MPSFKRSNYGSRSKRWVFEFVVRFYKLTSVTREDMVFECLVHFWQILPLSQSSQDSIDYTICVLKSYQIIMSQHFGKAQFFNLLFTRLCSDNMLKPFVDSFYLFVQCPLLNISTYVEIRILLTPAVHP